MARKGWDALSESYRKRLLRSGVTEQQYTSGTPLHGARGHRSASAEAHGKAVRKFADTYTKYFPEDRERTLEHLRHLPTGQAKAYMRHVQEMNRLYADGNQPEAHRLWEMRDKRLPDYMFYYHGIFAY